MSTYVGGTRLKHLQSLVVYDNKNISITIILIIAIYVFIYIFFSEILIPIVSGAVASLGSRVTKFALSSFASHSLLPLKISHARETREKSATP